MDVEKFQEYLEKFQDWAVVTVPKVIVAVIILYVGLFIVKRIVKAINKGLERAKLEIEIQEFLKSIISLTLKIVVFLIAAGVAGIKMLSLIHI